MFSCHLTNFVALCTLLYIFFIKQNLSFTFTWKWYSLMSERRIFLSLILKIFPQTLVSLSLFRSFNQAFIPCNAVMGVKSRRGQNCVGCKKERKREGCGENISYKKRVQISLWPLTREWSRKKSRLLKKKNIQSFFMG